MEEDMEHWLKLLKKLLLVPITIIFKVEEKITYEKYKAEKRKRKNIKRNMKLTEDKYIKQRKKVHELQKKFDNVTQHNKNLHEENTKYKLRNKQLEDEIEKVKLELKEMSEREGINEN